MQGAGQVPGLTVSGGVTRAGAGCASVGSGSRLDSPRLREGVTRQSPWGRAPPHCAGQLGPHCPAGRGEAQRLLCLQGWRQDRRTPLQLAHLPRSCCLCQILPQLLHPWAGASLALRWPTWPRLAAWRRGGQDVVASPSLGPGVATRRLHVHLPFPVPHARAPETEAFVGLSAHTSKRENHGGCHFPVSVVLMGPRGPPRRPHVPTRAK